MEHKGEAIFDIPFMIQSHAESMKKILGAIQDLPANQHSQFSHNLWNWAGLAVLVSWQILKGSQDFLHTFSMALYHKWDVKNGFAFVLQFFSLISDGLGGVRLVCKSKVKIIRRYCSYRWISRLGNKMTFYFNLICTYVYVYLIYSVLDYIGTYVCSCTQHTKTQKDSFKEWTYT